MAKLDFVEYEILYLLLIVNAVIHNINFEYVFIDIIKLINSLNMRAKWLNLIQKF
jgi:hypothetical protein